MYCNRQFVSSIARRRHELRCNTSQNESGSTESNAHSHQCDVCRAVLPSSQSLYNHKASCTRRRNEKLIEDRKKRERDIENRLFHQQLEQVDEIPKETIHSGKNRKRQKQYNSNPQPPSKKTKKGNTFPSERRECGTCSAGEENQANTKKSDKFKCNICGKIFINERFLLKHRRSHYKRREEGYLCKLCDTVFFTGNDLREHNNCSWQPVHPAEPMDVWGQ